MAERSLSPLLRTLLPWLITALLLFIVFTKVDIVDTFQYLKEADLRLFLPAAVFFNVYAFFINSLFYTKLINWFCGKVSYKTVLSIRGASFLISSINPGAGQGGLYLWLSRKEKLPLKNVLGASLMAPLLDTIFVTIALLPPIITQLAGGNFIPRAHFKILAIVEAVLFVLVSSQLSLWAFGLWRKAFKGAEKISWLYALRTANLRHYGILLLLRCAQHIPNLLTYYIALRAFHGDVPFIVFLVRFFPALIIQYIPLTIAQMGTAQGGWALMFGDLVDLHIIVAFTLSWNLLYLLVRMTLGAFFFRGEARDYFRGNWRNKANEASIIQRIPN
jgi:hypothetical protein